MQKKIKKSAAAFIEKYGLNKETLTVSRLREIIESLDFVVVDYRSNVKNDSDVTALLEKTKSTEFHLYTKSFVYCTPEEKYVFLCMDMSADDTIDVLLHELGHICLEHLGKDGIIHNTGVQKEREAFFFSQYIQQKCRKSKRIQQIKLAGIVLAVLVLFSASVWAIYNTVFRKTVVENGQTIILVGDTGAHAFLHPHYYWTDGGKVFHLWRDCQHIMHSSNIYAGTLEKSGKENCCKTCYKKFCQPFSSEAE